MLWWLIFGDEDVEIKPDERQVHLRHVLLQQVRESRLKLKSTLPKSPIVISRENAKRVTFSESDIVFDITKKEIETRRQNNGKQIIPYKPKIINNKKRR
jgi:hypothetical protein